MDINMRRVISQYHWHATAAGTRPYIKERRQEQCCLKPKLFLSEKAGTVTIIKNRQGINKNKMKKQTFNFYATPLNFWALTAMMMLAMVVSGIAYKFQFVPQYGMDSTLRFVSNTGLV